MSELRALLIDDEKDFVAVLAERLGYRGVQAEWATDGRDALEKLRRGTFDVVLLDLKLPGMSGQEVLKRIHQEHAGLPVILISGHGALKDQWRRQSPDVFDYLVKPVNVSTLVATMRKAAGKA
jgi:DNA-binding NtrC family response regulator